VDDSRQIIKIKGVALTVYPWRHSSGKIHWRFAWYDHRGDRKYTTRAEKSAAVAAARNKAREIHNGTMDLGSLSDEQARLCRAFLDLRPDWSLIERLRSEQERELVSVSDAFEKFIDSKKSNAGSSPHNLRTLRNRVGYLVAEFGDRMISSLSVSELDSWLTAGEWAPSTKVKIRASSVTFFRWCRVQGLLPDQTTEAEKMARPIVMKSAPTTLDREELAAMLAAVHPEFLPWLAISAWAGVRSEELYPHRDSEKHALDWENIDLPGRIITIPREVSKTNERRIIPICDALAAVLVPISRPSGRITGHRAPSDRKHGELAETLHLGALIGGWRNNALRHSFVSYRCALVGVGSAAMEAGNSEAETRRSYRDAKSEAEGEEWFGS